MISNILAWFGSSRIGTWTIINLGSHIDRFLIKASGGKMNSTFLWPCLLLTTTGQSSGKPRTTPLLYMEDGDNFVIIASRGGHQNHPSWYLNLKANPEVEVFVNGQTQKRIASDAQGPDRERLWQMAVDIYSGYDVYKERAGDREIPLVILSPK